jgi:hypothetical protein
MADVSQVGFKIFLNVTPTVTNWTSDNTQFSLIFEENPLADFVELPDDGRAQDELWFSNILCGVLRGSLEMVSSQIPDQLGLGSLVLGPITDPASRFKCRSKHTLLVTYCVEMIPLRCGSHLYDTSKMKCRPKRSKRCLY